MLTALVSAKGSPGVTTLALAMFNAWPGRALLVGADPAGDDLHQMLVGLDHGDGLLRLGFDRSPLAASVWEETLALDPGTQQRLALFGIRHPGQARSLVNIWEPLGRQLRGLAAENIDVIADAGRYAVAHPPTGLLQNADRVLVCTRGQLWSIDAAAALVRTLHDSGITRRAVRVVVIGPTDYPPAELAASTGINAAVLPGVPIDDSGADRLRAGLVPARTGGKLLRATRELVTALTQEWAQDVRAESAELQEVMDSHVDS